jgi:hypothetical protein
MKIGLRLLGRAIVLLGIWTGAGFAAVSCFQRCVEHRRMTADVHRLSKDYDRSMSDYAGVLVEGQRISDDPDYQVHLLKQRFGFSRPNETPIVVQIEDGR